MKEKLQLIPSKRSQKFCILTNKTNRIGFCVWKSYYTRKNTFFFGISHNLCATQFLVPPLSFYSSPFVEIHQDNKLVKLSVMQAILKNHQKIETKVSIPGFSLLWKWSHTEQGNYKFQFFLHIRRYPWTT